MALVHRDAAHNFDSKPPLLGVGLHHIQPICSDGQCVFPTPEKVQGVFAAKKEEQKFGRLTVWAPARLVFWNPKIPVIFTNLLQGTLALIAITSA